MNKTIHYNGSALSYQSTGRGTAVVLLHGFAEDAGIWEGQVSLLQDKYRLIIPDLPGSGQSEALEDAGMEALAGSVKAILEEEQIDEAIMIGHSMGGYLTLAFAEKFPELLRGFGLFHSTAYADTEEKKATRRKNIAFINTRGSFEFLKQSTPTLFGENFRKDHPEEIDKLIERYKDFDPVSLCRYYEGMIARPDRTHVLKGFVKPVLFIIGRQDNAIPFKDSLELCHLPALAYIHILDKAGHMGMLEEPEKSNQALEKFLHDSA